MRPFAEAVGDITRRGGGLSGLSACRPARLSRSARAATAKTRRGGLDLEALSGAEPKVRAVLRSRPSEKRTPISAWVCTTTDEQLPGRSRLKPSIRFLAPGSSAT
jgi:hypothetical protein